MLRKLRPFNRMLCKVLLGKSAWCMHPTYAWINRHRRLCPYLRWLFCFFTPTGFEFHRRGDSVVWIWPWRRRSSKVWLSVGCGGEFCTLAEIDNFWQEYYNAEMIAQRYNPQEQQELV